jgi:hypothetical protein
MKFDLEQAITKWRQQMLAAGITSPETLEELEGHLREEIEALVESGLHLKHAFEGAIRHMGSTGELSSEFANLRIYSRVDLMNRMMGCLGLVYFPFCLALDYRGSLRSDFPGIPTLIEILMVTMHFWGLIASLLVICAQSTGNRFNRMQTWSFAIVCAVGAIFAFDDTLGHRIWNGVLAGILLSGILIPRSAVSRRTHHHV